MTMKKFLIILSIFYCISLTSQEQDLNDSEKEEAIPFSIIDQVPVHPNCKGLTNSENKKCFDKMMQKHIIKNFNTDVANCIEKKMVYNEETKKEELKCIGLNPGKKRLYVQFKIDSKGDIVNVKVRAPHPALDEEARRVMRKYPKMSPGLQRGKPVGVHYTVPITFLLE